MTISKVTFFKTTDQLTGENIYTPINWENDKEEKLHLRDYMSRKIDHFRKGSGTWQSWYWVVRGEDGCNYPLPLILDSSPGSGEGKFLKAKIQLLKELMG